MKRILKKFMKRFNIRKNRNGNGENDQNPIEKNGKLIGYSGKTLKVMIIVGLVVVVVVFRPNLIAWGSDLFNDHEEAGIEPPETPEAKDLIKTVLLTAYFVSVILRISPDLLKK